MAEYNPFPDAEAAVSWWLRQANVASGRVYSSIPATPTFPLIVIQRIGGVPAVRQKLDRARIQINVWGTSKSEARSLADAARLRVHELEGKSVLVSNGAPAVAETFVTAVDDDTGLFWSPDDLTDRDRYIFGVSIYHHAV